MDDDFLQLESELQRLRPIAPSPEVEASIAGSVASTRTYARRSWFAAILLPLAAAVAFAIVARVIPSRGSRTPAPALSRGEFKPIAAENLLVHARDEGLVTLDDGTPARRIRQTYIDTITWKNAQTHASLQWRLPREEVNIVPIALQ